MNDVLLTHMPRFLHGGDYNPDQWLDRPDILQQDIRVMQKAKINVVSVGIFAWSALEPQEGKYTFEWLDQVIDRLYHAGISVILSTPSGAKPAWMAQAHPEVRRVNKLGLRENFSERENHCLTSPYYREKVREIDTALAQRYAGHPGVILWHLGNEFNGECYCPLCAQAFRDFLKEKYGTLDALNHAWWNAFWSHTISDWDQIDPPTTNYHLSTSGQQLDWKRFCTAQVKSFIGMERDAVQSVTPKLPVTINMMSESFWDYDYFSLCESVDIASWDAYPTWHSADNLLIARDFAASHDLTRSMKKKNFLLMESTPSTVNWAPVCKLKRPNMHRTASLQAVAHGSDSVCYFQIRKGQGANEMWHGAVIDHDCREDTRVIRDVTSVGTALENITNNVFSKPISPKVCILLDYQNLWAIRYAQAAHNGKMDQIYLEFVRKNYRYFWKKGISVDFCDMRECTDLSPYTLVVAPMLFMFRNGIEEKLRDFVQSGGTMLVTCYSGMVDENGLAYQYARPHGLVEVLGLSANEVDALYDQDENHFFLNGTSYAIHTLAELNENQTAQEIAHYSEDFYQGMPVLTRHAYGKGIAWYLGALPDQDGLDAIYDQITKDVLLPKATEEDISCGVIATRRGNAVFLQNYSDMPKIIKLSRAYDELLSGKQISGTVEIAPFDCVVLKI